MTNISVSRILSAIGLALITTIAASAQSSVAQTTAREPAREQNTNKSSDATRQSLPGVEVFAVPLSKPAPKDSQKVDVIAAPASKPALKGSQNEIEIENAVIPPAPIIIKRNAKAIAIPVDGAAATAPAKTDSKYEEHPAVSSGPSVGSVFGYRRDPFTRREKFHSGVDMKARWGDPVGASQAGVVQFAGWYHGYGNMIIVSHGGGVTTHYAHLSSFYVEVGTRVERGSIIGRAGSTGRATSPHLHYELRFEGNALNPFQPLVLDPSSDYFTQSRPTVDAGRAESTLLAAPLRDK